MQKPLPTLLSSALEAVTGGWEQAELFAYFRTGLALLEPDECDLLENYCFTWNIGYKRWHSAADWRMHPDGWGGSYGEEAEGKLARINALRRRAAAAAAGAGGRRSPPRARRRSTCAALAGFFDGLNLAQALSDRAAALERAGRGQAAAEYARVWGRGRGRAGAVRRRAWGHGAGQRGVFRLYLLALSQYNVGVIPVSLDMVTAGDMDRNAPEAYKRHLIVPRRERRGACPPRRGEGGVFHRRGEARAGRAGPRTGRRATPNCGGNTRSYINCVSLPSESLTISAPAFGPDGQELEPSFLVRRAAGLFGLTVSAVSRERDMLECENTAAALAAEPAPDAACGAARSISSPPPRTGSGGIERAAAVTRGRLSRESALGLYGRDMRLSPLAHGALCELPLFLLPHLRPEGEAAGARGVQGARSGHFYTLRPAAHGRRRAGGADLPRSPTAILCGVLRANSRSSILRRSSAGREGKSARFLYLFERLAAAAERIVQDMAEELARLGLHAAWDFELDLSEAAPGDAPGRTWRRERQRRGQGRPRGRLGARWASVPARGGLQDGEEELFPFRRLLRAEYADAALPLHPHRVRALRAPAPSPPACSTSRRATISSPQRAI